MPSCVSVVSSHVMWVRRRLQSEAILTNSQSSSLVFPTVLCLLHHRKLVVHDIQPCIFLPTSVRFSFFACTSFNSTLWSNSGSSCLHLDDSHHRDHVLVVSRSKNPHNHFPVHQHSGESFFLKIQRNEAHQKSSGFPCHKHDADNPTGCFQTVSSHLSFDK